MAKISFSRLDLAIAQAKVRFDQLIEAYICSAHGESIALPTVNDVPEYLVEALVHFLDEDQKAYQAELEAQWRQELGP
jgi:hypothetical protein